MKTRKIDFSKTRTYGCSMADPPADIFYDIMLRLSIRTIVMSKSVCKSWRVLISNPAFSKQHLAQEKPFPLIRDRQKSCFSRAVYMVESIGESDFGTGYCSCYSSARECNCPRTMKVKSKLKIPIRNKDIFLSQVKGDIANVVFGTNRSYLKRKNYQMVSVGSLYQYVFTDVNSCNGLLCLSSSYENRVVVCNPITGEYICLPDPPYNTTFFCKVCIGFSPKSNQYKVILIRMSCGDAIEIHTVGTKIWTSVGLSEFQPRYGNSYVCLKGAIHWVCFGNDKRLSRRIACFNLDEECFRSPFPIPNALNESSNYMSIKLLGDRLCLYDHNSSFDPDGRVDVWAMEEYGVAKSWTRLLSINISRRGKNWGIRAISSFQTLSCTSDETILLLDEYNTLIYCDRQGVISFKHIKSHGNSSEFEVTAHIPSFASLKDMVDTTDTEIGNVYSGCGEIQLMEENYPVYLA